MCPAELPALPEDKHLEYEPKCQPTEEPKKFEYGTSCNLQCAHGYTKKSGSQVYECNDLGEWKEHVSDDGTLVCEEGDSLHE